MQKGDIIEVEYDLWLAGTNELIETTHEEIARKHNLYDEKHSYRPIYLVVGNEMVWKGADNSFLNAEVGKEYEVELAPADAAGERNPELVEVHSIREIARLPEFRKKDTYPEVGKTIVLNGKIGIITRITAGRVTVDFNHVLAGKKLKYCYKILRRLESIEDKVKAYIEMNYGRSDDFRIEIAGDETTITLADACKYDQNWFIAKYKLVANLRALGLKKIRFVEEYIKKEEPKIEEKKEEKVEPQPPSQPQNTTK